MVVVMTQKRKCEWRCNMWAAFVSNLFCATQPNNSTELNHNGRQLESERDTKQSKEHKNDALTNGAPDGLNHGNIYISVLSNEVIIKKVSLPCCNDGLS